MFGDKKEKIFLEKKKEQKKFEKAWTKLKFSNWKKIVRHE